MASVHLGPLAYLLPKSLQMRRNHLCFCFSLLVLSLLSISLIGCDGTTAQTTSPKPPLQPSTQSSSSPVVTPPSPQPPAPPRVLPPTAPPPAPTPLPAKRYVGSAQSNKYHNPSCEWAQKITHPVWFNSVVEAQDKGYVPCKVCKPPSSD